MSQADAAMTPSPPIDETVLSPGRLADQVRLDTGTLVASDGGRTTIRLTEPRR